MSLDVIYHGGHGEHLCELSVLCGSFTSWRLDSTDDPHPLSPSPLRERGDVGWDQVCKS